MYDEPFAGLDSIAMGVVVKLIRTLNQVFGMTSIVVSHDVGETASIADLIYVIADGVVVGSAIVNQIAEQGTDPGMVEHVAAFVKSLGDAVKKI